MIRKTFNVLNQTLNYFETLVLSFIVLIFCLLRVPSVIEPYWYGDEGVYQVLGIAMNQGRLLYAEIWDNKPPLLYIIYALFNGDLFYVRLLSLIVGALSIVAIFLLASKLFKNKLSVYISTVAYALIFAVPIIEGNIANSENFMLLPTIAAFYMIVASSQKKKFMYTAIAGILLSIAFLIKIVAIFDFAALFVTIFVLRFYEDLRINKENIKKQIKNITTSIEQETLLIISFASPIALTALYFLAMGAFSDFYRATFSQNVGYVGYGNYLLFPMGLLFLKLSLLIFSILIIMRYRKILGPAGIVILIWLSFSAFNAFFSQRPYTHYLLVLLPSLALFLGFIIENKKLTSFTVPLLIILLVLVFGNFRLNFKKTFLYYENYLAFIVDGKSPEAYQVFFDKNTPRDYEIARFIESKTGEQETVFIWGDSPQIYALSGKLPPGRYAVSYHITFYKDAIEETKRDIESKKPKYIIQIKESPEISNFLDRYEFRYRIGDVKIYERQS